MRISAIDNCCGASSCYNGGAIGLSTANERTLRREVAAARQGKLLTMILRDNQIAKGGDRPDWASAEDEKKRAHFRKVLKELGFVKVARWNNAVHNSKLNLFVYNPYQGSAKMRGW